VTALEYERTTPSLHQLVGAAIERSSRAREESRALIEDHERLDRALRDTLMAIDQRRAQRPRRSETDRSGI
jgi:hypothetical protein